MARKRTYRLQQVHKHELLYWRNVRVFNEFSKRVPTKSSAMNSMWSQYKSLVIKHEYLALSCITLSQNCRLIVGGTTEGDVAVWHVASGMMIACSFQNAVPAPAIVQVFNAVMFLLILFVGKKRYYEFFLF